MIKKFSFLECFIIVKITNFLVINIYFFISKKILRQNCQQKEETFHGDYLPLFSKHSLVNLNLNNCIHPVIMNRSSFALYLPAQRLLKHILW